MPHDYSEEWILDEFAPPTPSSQRKIIRVLPGKKREFSSVFHLVQASGPDHGPRGPWSYKLDDYEPAGPGLTTWCSKRWPEDDDMVDYDPAVHTQKPCVTCTNKERNARTGYLNPSLWVPRFVDVDGYGQPRRKPGGKPTNPLVRVSLPTWGPYEVESATGELSNREIHCFVHHTPDREYHRGVWLFIRYSWEKSPAGKRVLAERWKQQRAEYEQKQEEKAAYWHRKNMLEPRWVTTKAQQYRHIYLGYPLANNEQGWRDLACGNKITVHLCAGDELQLAICPRCALAYKDMLIEAELTLPDGTKLPEPMVKRIMAMDPRNKEKE